MRAVEYRSGRARGVLLALVALLCALVAMPIAAQVAPPSPQLVDATTRLGRAEVDLRLVDRQLDASPDDKQQALLRARADAAGKTGAAVIDQLQSQIASVDARIVELGPRAPGGDPPEIASQRVAFTAERAALDAATRRGRLLSVAAGQLTDEIDRSRSEKLGQMLSTRVPSPVTPAFWNALLHAAPRDLRRTNLFLTQGADQIRDHWHGGLPWQVLIGLGLAFLILFPVRAGASKLARRYLIDDAPGHRLRRSANALQRMIVGTAAPLFAAVAVVGGIQWAGLFPARWNAVFDAFVAASGFTGFVIAVTSTVLMASQPSWRIAPLDNATVVRLRPLVWPLGLLSAASILAASFNTSVGVSPAALVATQGLEATLRLVLLVAALVILGRLRAEQRGNDDPTDDASTPPGLSAIILVAWIVAIVALLTLLIGYVRLSSFILQMFSWATILGCAVYLLSRAVDDIATSLFSRDSPFGHAVTRAVGVRPSIVDQFGLILAGILRLLLYVVGLGLLFTPFGAAGVGALFGRLGILAQGVEIGGVSISPGAILRGIVVLGIGLALVRAFLRWLETRYLPATDLDLSSRDSVGLITRYVGIALAVIWALASLGIGVERIAILLSALSVGIGFGLQAITSNFVSGLILLAERPVKIGDLIKVGNDEGDVKRISVRSTEIELADHSTLIVPNSELITKTVLNKTRANALGRIAINFSVPMEIDVRKVRQMVLDVFAAEDGVLDDPAPSVFIDSLVEGRVVFACYAHTSGPRTAYGTRSRVFLDLLARFHDEGIDIGTPPQKLELARVSPAGAETGKA